VGLGVGQVRFSDLCGGTAMEAEGKDVSRGDYSIFVSTSVGLN
jgi:hypothetical protein